jgi:hypothetical protein
MAIKVYNSKFVMSNPEASRVKLSAKKLMGFTIAYCDNDETTSRENFIGSMDMPSDKANDNYITADYFGSMLLVDRTDITQVVSLKNVQDQLVRVFPNPAKNLLNIERLNGSPEEMSFEIRSITGALLKASSFNTRNQIIDLNDLIPGIYFLTVSSGKFRQTERIIK